MSNYKDKINIREIIFIDITTLKFSSNNNITSLKNINIERKC